MRPRSSVAPIMLIRRRLGSGARLALSLRSAGERIPTVTAERQKCLPNREDELGILNHGFPGERTNEKPLGA